MGKRQILKGQTKSHTKIYLVWLYWLLKKVYMIKLAHYSPLMPEWYQAEH